MDVEQIKNEFSSISNHSKTFTLEFKHKLSEFLQTNEQIRKD